MKNKIAKSMEVTKAIDTLADFLKIDTGQIVSRLALLDKKTFTKLKETYNSTIDFYQKPMKERAQLLGYEYKEHKDGSYEVSTEL